MKFPVGTTESTRERMRRMLDADRDDLLPQYALIESGQIATPEPTGHSRRRCRHLSTDPIGETKANCCGSQPLVVYRCQLLDLDCVPHQFKSPKDATLTLCRDCDRHAE